MEGFIKNEDISNQLIGIKSNPFEYCTAKPREREGLEQEGWEFVPSKRVTKSIRMKRQKTHYDAFEDRIWALFAKMNFAFINSNNQCQLQYANGLTKKIDVCAIDNEASIIVECKSAGVRKKESYQKDINELIGIKDGLRQAVYNLFPEKPKVAFIFAINNIRRCSP